MSTVWRSKWLDWQSGDEIISVSPETELTKLTKTNSVSFVSAIPGESPIISAPTDGTAPWQNPNTWRESFALAGFYLRPPFPYLHWPEQPISLVL